MQIDASTLIGGSGWTMPQLGPRPAVAPSEDLDSSGQHASETTRILIIDDTEAIHKDFRKILIGDNEETAGLDEAEASLFGTTQKKSLRKSFELDSAYQGEEGLSLVKQGLLEGVRYPVAFVDVRMPPGMDGIETVAKLTGLDPDIQIVLCTAYSDYTWKDMLEKLGNSDRLVILKKPFDTIEVLQLANALTEKWFLLKQAREKFERLDELVAQRTRHLQEVNARLESEVKQRKRREQCLALQSEVTTVLADSTATVEAVVSRILEIICRRMGWNVGELWTVDRRAKVLRFSTMWHAPGAEFVEFRNAAQPMVFEPGASLIGRVWESGQPAWILDLSKDEGFLRSKEAAAAGLRSGFAFPLRLAGEVLGIVDFFDAEIRSLEPEMLQVFATLGSQIGQAIERRKLEADLRQSQKMEAVGQLAGGVAHDFNNMICVIQGHALILGMNEGLDRETIDGLTQITFAAQRAAGLTKQLLTFSRRQMMHPKVLDVNEVASSLSKMLRRLLREDIALSLSPSNGPALTLVDEDMLSQVLVNLTVNARDAMPSGGCVSIGIEVVSIKEAREAHAEARPGNFVCLSVQDTGFGIAPETLPRIFEPFFTTKDVGQGTGLGLSTVHGIVKQHQGWIEVASQVGVGTTFRIYLPSAPASTESASDKPKDVPLLRGSETILLVEDDPSVRTLGAKLLQRLGYRVVQAASGLEALSVWEKHRNDIALLLTDVIMPEGLNGRELAHQLRDQKPALKIIYASGYTSDLKFEENELIEGENFLQKPYDPKKLAKAIRVSLDGKSGA